VEEDRSGRMWLIREEQSIDHRQPSDRKGQIIKGLWAAWGFPEGKGAALKIFKQISIL
jgi:hypothetical protein